MKHLPNHALWQVERFLLVLDPKSMSQEALLAVDHQVLELHHTYRSE